MDEYQEEVVKETQCTTPIETVPPQIRIEQWKEDFMEVPVFFQVYHLKDSYFIWVGSSPAKLNNLSLATQTSFDKVPSVSTIVGTHTEGAGRSLALRLAKRTGKLVFVSFNVDTKVAYLGEWVEKKLVPRLQAKQ